MVKEIEINVEVANGFSKELIDKKIKKFKNQKSIEDTSTLEKEKAEKIFKEFNISLAQQNKFTINLIKANKIDNTPTHNQEFTR